MIASAAARFIVARRCAFSDRQLSVSSRRPIATVLKRYVALDAFQKRAASVWSALRNVMFARPMSFTSLKSSAYCSLSSAGGPEGRNWSWLSMPHVVIVANCGVAPDANDGGVGRHWPTAFPPRNCGGAGVNPSVLRHARIASATSFPHARPRRTDCPFEPLEIASSDAVRLALRSAACDG